MRLRELINEGPTAQGVGNVARSVGGAAGATYQKAANTVQQVASSPTVQGIGSGIQKSFGGKGYAPSAAAPASSNVLKGIDTNALKLGLTKIIDKQTVQPDELIQLKKLLDKLD